MHKFYLLNFSAAVDFNDTSIDLKNGVLKLSPDKQLSKKEEKLLHQAVINYLQTLYDFIPT